MNARCVHLCARSCGWCVRFIMAIDPSQYHSQTGSLKQKRLLELTVQDADCCLFADATKIFMDRDCIPQAG